MADRNSKSASSKVATHRRNAKVSLSISEEPVPRLPHERDESADSQTSEPRMVIQNAAADLKRGQTDTDRGAQMNQVYRKLKVGL